MRSILAFALALSILPVAFAEDTPGARETNFAIGGGLMINNSEISGDIGENFDEEVSASLNIGARAMLRLSDNWQFRTGLFLQEKSAMFNYDNGFFDGDMTIRIIQASIPVQIQWQAFNRVGFFGGYSADVRINDYCTTDGDLDSCKLSRDSKSVIHNLNLGVNVFVHRRVDIDVTYQHGLSPIYEEAGDDIKIHSFMVQGFFKF
jgi:hypothetical protein